MIIHLYKGWHNGAAYSMCVLGACSRDSHSQYHLALAPDSHKLGVGGGEKRKREIMQGRLGFYSHTASGVSKQQD